MAGAMRQRPEDAWRQWVAAEDAGRADQVDDALRDLFTAVPRLEPTPELSRRLMLLAARPVPETASEKFVVMGLLVAALGMTLLPVAVLLGLFVYDAGGVVAGIARTCVWLTEWMTTGVSTWGVVSRVGHGLGYAANSPTGSAALTITLLIASSALLVLNRYLPAERS